jgi:hypothetical protein
MAWAPERGTALFTGANHGSPHRLNDVWEFDLPGMAWVLLYAPDLPRGYADLGPDSSDVIYADGNLRSHRGGPAVVGHTWSGLTYDIRQQCLLFMNTWPIDVDRLIVQKGGDPKTRDRSPPVWAFCPSTGTWSKWRSSPPWPKAALGALLEYVPELNGSLWHMNNWQLRGSWLLGGEPPAWRVVCDESVQQDFTQQAPGRELVGYHDPIRKQVIAHRGQDTFHFDTETLRWTRRQVPHAPDGHDARGVLLRDPGGGGGLYVDLKDATIWVYEPQTPLWKRLEPAGDPMPKGPRMLAYVDFRFGLLVVIDDAVVWAFRPPHNADQDPSR